MSRITFVDKHKPSRIRKRSLWNLLIAIGALVVLSLLLYFLPPQQMLFQSVPLLTTTHTFLALLFIFCFSLGTYAFKSKAHGTIIASFISAALVFLLNDLRHPFFFILLFALFLTLELAISYRR